MKKITIISILLIMCLLVITVSGCTDGSDSAGGSKDSSDKSQAIESADSSNTDSKNNGSSSSTTEANESNVYVPPVNEEEEKLKGNLTGIWEVTTPLADGSVSYVDIKIDNVNGFTLTTGTGDANGTGTFYNRVGSYRFEGDHIFFMATTGGESSQVRTNDYSLRADPGVFEYTFSENEELTQLTLTPVNENAILLTGEGTLVLTKV